MWACDGVAPDRLLRGFRSELVSAEVTEMRSGRQKRRRKKKALSSRVSAVHLLVTHGYNLSRDKQARSWCGAALMRLAARQAKHCVFVHICTAEDLLSATVGEEPSR